MRRNLLLMLALPVALLLCIPLAFSESIIINSRDWKDVYSGMQYGYLTGQTPRFLTSERHATLILKEMNKQDPITAFSSSKNPFIVGYVPILKSNGFNGTEIRFKSLSLELAKKLTNINSYIILDDSYGYNAIAVAPYAILSNSYVLFADRTNIGDVTSFLKTKSDVKIMIYGTTDSQVRDALAVYNPDIINYDGDRFANNVEIVKRYKKIKDVKQVLLSNGEIIEAEIMSGEQPVLFTGTQSVPAKIQEYIKNSNIEVGVLIGNDLVGAATMVRRQTGISTFVKFARSAREPQGPVAQIEGLDIFRLPKYNLAMTIKAVKYNALTKQIEVTLENQVEQAVYFKGTYTIMSGGNQSQTIGDLQPIFLDGKESKTVVYEVDAITDDKSEISAKVFVLFGEAKESLDMMLEGTFPVDRVEIMDDAVISIEKVEYHKQTKKLYVYLKNIGNGTVDAFANIEAIDMKIVDEYRTYGADKIVRLSPGSSGKSVISIDMSDADLDNNARIKIRAYYGERQDALVKVLEGEFDLLIKAVDVWTYVPIAIIILLIILLILAKRKKGKKETKGHSHHHHHK